MIGDQFYLKKLFCSVKLSQIKIYSFINMTDIRNHELMDIALLVVR